MQITALKIHTGNIHAQENFYGNTLGLSSQIMGNELKIQIGSSELEFIQNTNFTGRYHFAFTIPKNQFEAGVHWLEQRTAIASDANGKTRFETGEWNADNVYFYDPQGNILELIARHDLDESSLDKSNLDKSNLESTSQATFGPHSLLHISEIGLASPNVLEMIAWFASTLEVGTYKSFDETFAPIGDVRGLVIAVLEDRIWFPDTGIPAQILPVKLTIHGQQISTHQIPNTPYIVHVRPKIREPA